MLTEVKELNMPIIIYGIDFTKIRKRIPPHEVSASCYWFAAIGKAAFFGSFFGKWLTGISTPFAMSSARRAFFFASISAEILRTRDVLIAFELNGEPTDFRIIIPEERAMFWVRYLREIGLIAQADATEDP